MKFYTLGFKIIPNKTKSNTKFNCYINILKVNIHPFGAQVFNKSFGEEKDVMFKRGKFSFHNAGKQLRKSRSTIATHYHLVIAIKRCYLFSAEEIKKTFQGMTLKTQESYSKDFQNKAKG